MTEENNNINVALVCDKNMEVGLHLTIVSMLRRASRNVHIHFFHEDFTEEDIKKLELSIQPYKEKAELSVYKINENKFSNASGWFGKKIVYIRLTLPDILPQKRVLYLDCDLIVNIDIAKLYDTTTEDYAAVAHSDAKVGETWEKDFLLKRGMNPEIPYMNTGALLVDCENWKEQKITERCLKVVENDKDYFPTADQTILNLVFEGNYKTFDESVQTYIPPSEKPDLTNLKETIYHFIMVPKPWELFGEFFHAGYGLYKQEKEGTLFENTNSWNSFSFSRLWRLIRTAKMYFKMTKTRLKKKRNN